MPNVAKSCKLGYFNCLNGTLKMKMLLAILFAKLNNQMPAFPYLLLAKFVKDYSHKLHLMHAAAVDRCGTLD